MFAKPLTNSESIHKKNTNSDLFLKAKPNETSFISPIIQTKLAIGQPNDKYEKEADQVADQVIKMPIGNESQAVQRKCNHCNEEKLQMKRVATSLSPIIQKKEEEEEMVQMKGIGNESKSSSSALKSSLQKSKGGGQSMDAFIQSNMEKSIGADFSKVKIHTNENAVQMNRSLNARAFTNGNDIYFNNGQYNPKNPSGRHLLAHELAHVVQQKGNKTQSNLIQRYYNAPGIKGSAIGHSYRIADDMTVAVKVGNSNHDFYAKAGKAATANTKLAKVGSGIELIELSNIFNVTKKGSKSKTLKKIVPKNKQNATSGNNMKIIDDCGKSCAVVVGGMKRTALHRDAMTGKDTKTAAKFPAYMKAEIMKKLLKHWLTMATTNVAEKTKIKDTIATADAVMIQVKTAKAELKTAMNRLKVAKKTKIGLKTAKAIKKEKKEAYRLAKESYGNVMMSYYNVQSESKREEIDKYLKINKYVDPDVGQGYTISSGGNRYKGKKLWNYHWAGVVMKSDDKKDTITLENSAAKVKGENKKWEIAMYGTAAKKGQTFHEQHHDTKKHGNRPTTMKIEKK